jgi:hypothetical protein
MGKVRQPPGVIDVQMRQHDVSDIRRIVPQSDHLSDRGLSRIEHRRGTSDEHRIERFPNVHRPESGLDEHQTVIRLDEQAVTDGASGRPALGGHLTHAAAVQVGDLHDNTAA